MDYMPFGEIMREDNVGGTSYQYTGQEYDKESGIHNYRARLYDSDLGRFYGMPARLCHSRPYRYGQTGGDPQEQFASPFSYAGNNPVMNVDPDGEFVFTALAAIFAPPLLPWAIGADIGMWNGGTIANGTANPFKWDYSSGRTWGYMAAGALVGGASGSAANAVATSGMPFANTAAIVTGSFANSIGTTIYTGGQTDVGVSFGIASYNFDKNVWGYLGKKGNSRLENIGYGLGGLANVSDILAGVNPSEVELQTENLSDVVGENKDLIGHSQLNSNGDVLIDFGPTGNWAKFEPGRNDWITYSSSGKHKLISDISGNRYKPISLKGVNLGRINRISSRMNSKPGIYQVLTRSCSSTCSRALTFSGIPAIGIHPYILHGQMYLRNLGVRPTLFAHHLNN